MSHKNDFFIFKQTKFFKKEFNLFIFFQKINNFILLKNFVLRFEVFLHFKGYIISFLYIKTYLNKNAILNQDIQKRKLLFMYLLFKVNSYKGYRHFLMLPSRGNRTWSNKKNQLRSNKIFFNYCRQLYFIKNKSSFSKNKENYVFYAEIINKL